MKKSTIFSLLLSLFACTAFAQNHFHGQVIDSRTRAPLAFVNIIANHTPNWGTTTDIDGKFTLECTEKIETLTLIYLGYETTDIRITPNTSPIILMQQNDLTLRQIIVIAGENPAHRIIRAAIKNRRQNNPEKVRSFRYKSYNKFIADVDFSLELFEEKNSKKITSEEKKKQIKQQSQSAQATFDSLHLMLIESITQRQYIRPNKSQETVLATRVSGLQNPTIAALATDIQPFSFYKSHIPLLGKNYINPISRGSTQMYRFRLEADTIFQRSDTIYVISFAPKKGANFEGLKGVLYINSNRYAVQNVIAEPAQANNAHLKIEQQYAFIQDQWFPTQLNFEARWKGTPDPATDLILHGKSYFKDIEINPDLKAKDFGIDAIVIAPEAGQQHEQYWHEKRLDSLTQKEQNSYQFIDSLGKRMRLAQLMNISENLLTLNAVEIGPVQVDLPRLLSNNLHEGTRLGLGLHTSDKLSKYVKFGGYFAYGLKDKVLKYGADLQLRHPENRFEPTLRIAYFNDLREPGQIYAPSYPPTYIGSPSIFARSLQAARMDSIVEKSISMGFRPFRHAKLSLGLRQNSLHPQYEYATYFDNIELKRAFPFNTFSVNFRYAFKEEYVRIGARRIANYTPFPRLHIFYEIGLDERIFNQPGLPYDRLIISLSSDFKLKRLGETSIWMEAGRVRGITPYSILFNGNGSYAKGRTVFIPYTFQTMGLYEFAGDRFFNAFVYHNFGTLLFRGRKFQPDVILAQGIGFSTLSYPNQHFFIDLKDHRKGYFESGIALDNLVRFNLQNLIQIGLGIGVFYRYGAYHLPRELDNYALKFRVGASF